MPAIDQNSLVTDANAYQAITSKGLALRIIIWELQQIAGGSVAALTPQQLITQAGPYQAITSEGLADRIIIYLLGQILANGAGGVSGGVAGNYAGQNPLVGAGVAAAAGSSLNFAEDTSNGRLWIGWSGVWH